VNETMARQIWGEEDPIGRTLETDAGPESQWRPLTVVGVAADAHVISLDGAVDPYIYVPMAQRYISRVSVLVKRTGSSSIPQIRAVIRTLNPNLPVTQALSMADVTAVGLIPQRVAAAVAGSLGIVGLLLAAIGVNGVVSYSVSRRTREIGIRVALGADPQYVRRLVLGHGLGLALIGTAIGAAAGAVLSQIIRALLFGINALDPVTFGTATALFIAVAAGASWAPARRAAGTDPMLALRSE
jgi:putative ABC transport system permease protein